MPSTTRILKILELIASRIAELPNPFSAHIADATKAGHKDTPEINVQPIITTGILIISGKEFYKQEQYFMRNFSASFPVIIQNLPARESSEDIKT